MTALPWRCAGALALAVAFASCSATRPLHKEPAGGTASENGDLMSPSDHARLGALSADRTADSAATGYRIGTDDLLEIRIPDLVDVQARSTGSGTQTGTVPGVTAAPTFTQGLRVDAHGDINVTMLGTLHAGGLTPSELEGEIARRLIAGGILRTPQVAVQVVEYRAHVVAVIGSVERPGLYPVTRPGATVADLVWAAGGPSKDAGRVLEFVPALSAPAHPGVASAAPATTPPVGAAPASTPAQPAAGSALAGAPIRIDLEILLHAAGRESSTVNPPVRPGDTISIAPGGSVLVDGWVDRPGSYPVTRGLTVSGAIAAAGGNLFPGDRRHTTVKRLIGPGEQRSFTVDLEAVADGRVADVPLTDGDVVQLPAAPARLLPWGFWSVAKEMVHIGGSVLLF